MGLFDIAEEKKTDAALLRLRWQVVLKNHISKQNME